MGWTKLSCSMCLCCLVLGAIGQGFENVARGKPCNQTRFDRNHIPCGNANNGNRTVTWDENCIIAQKLGSPPWWQVDLGRKYPVYRIKIYGYTSFAFYHFPPVITVDGQRCSYVTWDYTSRIVDMNCTSPIYGRVVRAERSASTPLSMCEFEVRVCQAGFYGDNCDIACSGCGGSKICHPVNGQCYDACVGGRYGDKCDKACPQCAKCCRDSGECTRCYHPNAHPPSCAERTQDESTDIETVVGAAVGAAVLVAIIAIVVVIIFFRRRKRTPESNTFNDEAADSGRPLYEKPAAVSMAESSPTR